MNRLADETSPYLLQHAANPVEWYPWGDEALGRARDEDRPILLSIGYSACHWCHVMAHESFEDPETAELMNRLFVNVKVDREERPDLDAVYMNATVRMTGHGGWPMTVFLTPAGEPFHCGTYFPPEPRYGMPSFRQVLEAVDDAWRERRGEVQQAGALLAESLRRSADLAPSAEPLTDEILTGALPALRSAFDPEWGGFGGAPKFPAASTVGFMLRLHARTGSPDALRMATETLDGMALGGMHDLIGGGFHRYAVDRIWLVPHFEKMLYDNALLASAYLEGFAVTGERRYAQIAEDTLDYLVREMRLPEGGFASSQDADTDGEEGSTYVWTPAQLTEALGDARAATAAAYYGVTEAGNFEGNATVLRAHGEPPADLAEIRAALLERRLRRPQPGRDDKALAAWNGLALAALAQGGWRLRRPDLLEAARDCARFLLGPMTGADGRLRRTFRAGTARIPAYLDDHAAVCHGLLELALATGEPEWLPPARRLADEALARFARRAQRRLLHVGVRCRAAGRAPEGARRQPDAIGQRPTGPRADQARPHLCGARARAEGGGGHAACGRRDAGGSPRPGPDALDARSLPVTAARGRRRRAGGRSGHAGAGRRRPRGLPPRRGVRLRRRRRSRRDPAARGPWRPSAGCRRPTSANGSHASRP